MFVTKNQFFVFVACIAFGAIIAFVLSLVKLTKFLSKHKIVYAVFDFVWLSFSSLLFSYYSHALSFPNFRPYMLLGVFCGFFGYFKSYHIILAKSIKKFYNSIVNYVPKKSRGKNDERKDKKIDSC